MDNPTEPFICSVCKHPIDGPMVGTGSGPGKSFAHRRPEDCRLAHSSDCRSRYKAFLVVKAQLVSAQQSCPNCKNRK